MIKKKSPTRANPLREDWAGLPEKGDHSGSEWTIGSIMVQIMERHQP